MCGCPNRYRGRIEERENGGQKLKERAGGIRKRQRKISKIKNYGKRFFVFR
jgi:hypothetical protein